MLSDDPRKPRLCELLRAASEAFIRETGGSPEQNTALRGEVDCMLALYQTGRLDPVSEFHKVSSVSSSLTGDEAVALH